jgi:hypothetical protein
MAVMNGMCLHFISRDSAMSKPKPQLSSQLLTEIHRIMKLGLKGHSVMVASGDDGVGGTFGCIAGTIFSPSWPST